MKLPPKQQILEKGAVFVAQWCQPNIEVNYKDVASQLDAIAYRVQQRLRIINPDHSLFKTKADIVAGWRMENLSENQWNVIECRQVIVAMRDVLYTELKFSGNNLAYYMARNSFINEVSCSFLNLF